MKLANKILTKLDNNELAMGHGAMNIDSVIEIEHQKNVKRLEKTLVNDPEYKQMKPFLEQRPELKEKYLNTLILNRSQMSPEPVKNLLEGRGKTAKQNSSREWSEGKSRPAETTHFSSSVRNSRYKHLDEKAKQEYFHNLKVIRKLQAEKKKRDKILEYFDTQKVIKEKQEELKRIEMENAKTEQRKQELMEWKEK